MKDPTDAVTASASVSIASQILRILLHHNLHHLHVVLGRIARAAPVVLQEQSALANALPAQPVEEASFSARSKTPPKPVQYIRLEVLISMLPQIRRMSLHPVRLPTPRCYRLRKVLACLGTSSPPNPSFRSNA